jgi:hypothetical protein
MEKTSWYWYSRNWQNVIRVHVFKLLWSRDPARAVINWHIRTFKSLVNPLLFLGLSQTVTCRIWDFSWECYENCKRESPNAAQSSTLAVFEFLLHSCNNYALVSLTGLWNNEKDKEYYLPDETEYHCVRSWKCCISSATKPILSLFSKPERR